MVRVGGLKYAIDPNARMGQRITRMTLPASRLDADKVQGRRLGLRLRRAARRRRRADMGRMTRYLRAKSVPPVELNVPAVEGVTGNPDRLARWRQAQAAPAGPAAAAA